MPRSPEEAAAILLDGLTVEHQQPAVRSTARQLLVIAGAGSGKTEVMARRVAWWIAVDRIPKENIVAFTFTEAAAEELKFRIRTHVERVTPDGEDATLGGMYVGTIHGFCLKLLRDWMPETYYNYDILDDAGRIALVQRGYHGLLGLAGLRHALGAGQFDTIRQFLRAYDLLSEYDELEVRLPTGEPPSDVAEERDWVTQAELLTDVGEGTVAEAFAKSAARLYAYMRARRFLDFSTSQSEVSRVLLQNGEHLPDIRSSWTHIVVDEVQDINPVQDMIIRSLVGPAGRLTAVGDHRQAIYAFRGGRVDLMERLHAELQHTDDGDVMELPSNFRSTRRIIATANAWSATIGTLGTLPNPPMTWGNTRRDDYSDDHLALHTFETREGEAEWIAHTIGRMVYPNENRGARHDDREGERGLSYSDMAILIRSSTDVRTYQETLRRRGIPSVVRAGPDLFSQPEVLLFLSLFAQIAGIDQFYGNPHRPSTLPGRVATVLGCGPIPSEIIDAACHRLRSDGFPLPDDTATRLDIFAEAIRHRIEEGGPCPVDPTALHCVDAAQWARRRSRPRRLFPQQIYHWLLEEVGAREWDTMDAGNRTAMFHLGQFSKLITSIETPGWTTSRDFRYQIVALSMWGAGNARTAEAPLLVPPDAVTITTVHSAKGLQFSAVFLADVNAMRFPSNYARRREDLPFSGDIAQRINPDHLADNDNYDNERRLMYVALTRAERYLYVSCSGQRRSRFMKTLVEIAQRDGTQIWQQSPANPATLEHRQRRMSSDTRLATSFSDLRYYLECPHDFYLRKVLGFAPTIDQAFGYGRGIHNILREIHRNPRRWGVLAQDRVALQRELRGLVRSGLFYLRYTTGDPLENMRRTALRGLTEYVTSYADELASLDFEPEREFETLIPNEELLISGSIDLVRLDDPPRVTIVDFKSGERGESNQSGLSEEMMRLQIGIYGLAARHELEYDPDSGFIRYIGEQDPNRRQVSVELGPEELDGARESVIQAGRRIRDRRFDEGPGPRNAGRCATCDQRLLCGRRQD